MRLYVWPHFPPSSQPSKQHPFPPSQTTLGLCQTPPNLKGICTRLLLMTFLSLNWLSWLRLSALKPICALRIALLPPVAHQVALDHIPKLSHQWNNKSGGRQSRRYCVFSARYWWQRWDWSWWWQPPLLFLYSAQYMSYGNELINICDSL